jgi:C4-dicarboxylate transporter, DctM subunit
MVPGLMLAAMFSGYVMLWSVFNRSRMPPPEPRPSLGESLRAAALLLPTIMLIVAVIGSIYAGLASPTEAAVIGVVGALASPGCPAGWIGPWLRRQPARRGHHHLHDRLSSWPAPSFLTVAMGYTGIPRTLAAWIGEQGYSHFALLTALAAVLHRAGHVPRRHLHRGADHLGDPADGGGGRDRPDLVRHLPGAGGRDEPDHPAGWLQPVRAAVHHRARHLRDRAMALPFFLILVLATAILSLFPQIALWLPGTMLSR